MHIDYILVGLGLAGIAVAEELEERGKSFVVFEDQSQTSSSVAGGLYNPVLFMQNLKPDSIKSTIIKLIFSGSLKVSKSKTTGFLPVINLC